MNRALARYVLPVLLPFLAALSGGFVGASQSVRVEVLAVFGAVLASVCSAFLAIANARLADRATDAAISARADLATALSRAGQPLVFALGELSSSVDEKSAQARRLLKKVVEIAQSQCGRTTSARPKVRASYYRLSGDERLELVYTVGRTNPRRHEFSDTGSKSDKNIFSLVRDRDSLLVPDLVAAPPANFALDETRTYKSLIVSPVRTSGRVFGILAVDSDIGNSLTTVDVGYVQLMSGLLSAGLAQLDGEEMGEATEIIEPSSSQGGR
ncbi:GAF domain-containing protein [Amycolatopsis sp. NPDC048633]|uniref:GAF domain-containing protein n=1 Tax=Amycolatopsis sp. NPDC048633 TaxID=3157095 RepID=UPI0033F60147